MSTLLKRSGLLFILGILLLTACQGQNAAEPTMDPDVIYTAAAMTVQAQLTQAAAENPTATFTVIPPTEAIADPALDQTPGTDQTDQQGTPGQPLATSTLIVLPSLTSTAVAPSSASACEWVDQDPDDGSTLGQGVTFDMTWTVKNTGTSTWTQLYTIEFFIGDRIGGGHYTENRYYLKEEVAPGEMTNLYVDMRTPNSAGDLYSWWKMKDEEGNNFCDLYVELTVAGAAKTSTNTPTVTSTPE